MRRIQLDRVHLELLLLAALFATLSGVVFPPMQRNGLNMTPLVAFCGAAIVGGAVLIHRRIFTNSTATRSRMRATVWFAFLGAIIGGAISSVVVGAPRSMVIAAAGGGLMFSAIGAQFGIVIKGHDEAARDAVETILDEKNVFVTPEHLWPNDTHAHAKEEPRDGRGETTTETSATNGSDDVDAGQSDESESDTRKSDDGEDETEKSDESDDATKPEADGRDETDESATDETDSSIERIDVSASSEWRKNTSDDSIPIPVIRSIESNDYSEE